MDKLVFVLMVVLLSGSFALGIEKRIYTDYNMMENDIYNISVVNATMVCIDGDCQSAFPDYSVRYWISQDGFTTSNSSVNDGKVSVSNDFRVDTNVFYVNATSNKVGVSNTNPVQLLEVGSGTHNGPVYVRVNSASNRVAGFTWANAGSIGSDGIWYMLKTNDNSNRLLLSNSTSPVMTFLQSGRVGIGTTSPISVLNVHGDLILNGSLTATDASVLPADSLIGDVSGGNYWTFTTRSYGVLGGVPVLSPKATFALGDYGVINGSLIVSAPDGWPLIGLFNEANLDSFRLEYDISNEKGYIGMVEERGMVFGKNYQYSMGEGHTITGTHSSILGGANNTVEGSVSMIGGGIGNTVKGDYATVLSGKNNTADSTWGVGGEGSVIVGGENNWVTGDYNSILTGTDNSITGAGNFIGSGSNNTIVGASMLNFIGSGSNNRMTNEVYGYIAGGLNNFMNTSGPANNILGGGYNQILGDGMDTQGNYVFGGYNTIDNTTLSNILGGAYNTIESDYSTIIGGINLKLSSTADYTTAVGWSGSELVINQPSAFIIAGQDLGVGTTAPTQKLHVEGNVNVTGEVWIDGVSGTGKVVCVKADGSLGVCGDQPDASGECTCG